MLKEACVEGCEKQQKASYSLLIKETKIELDPMGLWLRGEGEPANFLACSRHQETLADSVYCPSRRKVHWRAKS